MRHAPPAAAALILTLALALPAAAPATGTGDRCRGQDDPITLENVPRAERSLHCLVNVFRAQNGLDPLTLDPRLGRAARAHSEHMEEAGKLEHGGIGDGTPEERARLAGFDCGGSSCIGENIIATNFPVASPSDLIEAWKGSDGHRDNLLLPGYVTAGMGLALGPNLGIAGTQVFATVDNGARGTAEAMLSSAACDSARSSAAKAKGKVRAARRALATADSRGERRGARVKLKRAKKRAKTKSAAARRACDLSY